MRTRPTAIVTLAAATAVLLSGCAATTGVARDLLHDARSGASGARPCSSSEVGPVEPGPSPSGTPTLDPTVAHELHDAMLAVRALPAVTTATETTGNAPSAVPDPACPSRSVWTNHWSSAVSVTMDPGATPAESGAVPTTMAEHLAWTGVDLTLVVPAGPGHVASTVHYDGTFDQRIPSATSTAVAEGLSTLAATPHVAGLEAEIPTTMRVDYGSLTIGVDTYDQGVLDAVRAVVDTTAFAHTTLHGSFGNGAKP